MQCRCEVSVADSGVKLIWRSETDALEVVRNCWIFLSASATCTEYFSVCWINEEPEVELLHQIRAKKTVSIFSFASFMFFVPISLVTSHPMRLCKAWSTAHTWHKGCDYKNVKSDKTSGVASSYPLGHSSWRPSLRRRRRESLKTRKATRNPNFAFFAKCEPWPWWPHVWPSLAQSLTCMLSSTTSLWIIMHCQSLLSMFSWYGWEWSAHAFPKTCHARNHR